LKPACPAKVGVHDEWVLSFEVIPIMNSPELIDIAAGKVCIHFKIPKPER